VVTQQQEQQEQQEQQQEQLEQRQKLQILRYTQWTKRVSPYESTWSSSQAPTASFYPLRTLPLPVS